MNIQDAPQGILVAEELAGFGVPYGPFVRTFVIGLCGNEVEAKMLARRYDVWADPENEQSVRPDRYVLMLRGDDGFFTRRVEVEFESMHDQLLPDGSLK